MRIKDLVLVLPLFLLGCNENPQQICKDGIVYYQNGDSKNVYIKSINECIDIEEEKYGYQ